jgi:hypothetical protein
LPDGNLLPGHDRMDFKSSVSLVSSKNGWVRVRKGLWKREKLRASLRPDAESARAHPANAQGPAGSSSTQSGCDYLGDSLISSNQSWSQTAEILLLDNSSVAFFLSAPAILRYLSCAFAIEAMVELLRFPRSRFPDVRECLEVVSSTRHEKQNVAGLDETTGEPCVSGHSANSTYGTLMCDSGFSPSEKRA